MKLTSKQLRKIVNEEIVRLHEERTPEVQIKRLLRAFDDIEGILYSGGRSVDDPSDQMIRDIKTIIAKLRWDRGEAFHTMKVHQTKEQT